MSASGLAKGTALLLLVASLLECQQIMSVFRSPQSGNFLPGFCSSWAPTFLCRSHFIGGRRLKAALSVLLSSVVANRLHYPVFHVMEILQDGGSRKVITLGRWAT